MKILMLGWELPPHISGGLGVASEGIAQGLSNSGHKVDFLIPKKKKDHVSSDFKVTAASRLKPDIAYWKKKVAYTETIKITEMGMRLVPYLPPEVFEIAKEKQIIVEKIEESEESKLLEKIALTGGYTSSLIDELSKYALLASQYARKKNFDIIHAHDWITFKAGRMAAEEVKRPLFVHCHSTEYDRNGFHAQPFVIHEEKLGFEAAKRIFSVSQRLKDTIVEKYKINPSKIVVVPNATLTPTKSKTKKAGEAKEILFIGRFTHQKSPVDFIDVARDLVNRGINCKFSMIGDGYMRGELENKVAQKNLSHQFEFTGFLSQAEALTRLEKADLLIVPSASEPFGLVILEAAIRKIPVLAATGTGISEFIPSLPQVALWDKYNFVKMAERMLFDKNLKDESVKAVFAEGSKLSWKKSAAIIEQAYKRK